MTSSRAMSRSGSGPVASTTSAVSTSSSRFGRSGSQAGLRIGKRDVISCLMRSWMRLERAVWGSIFVCPSRAGPRGDV